MAAKPPWLAVHPLSPEDAPGATALRASVAAFKGKLAGTAARGPFDDVMERVAAPTDVTVAADTVGGIPGLWAKPARPRQGAAILHLHGGWFNLEPPVRTGTSSATSLRALELMLSYPIIGSLPSIASLLRLRTSRHAIADWSTSRSTRSP